MSISENNGGSAPEFHEWIASEFAARGALTALVVLAEIGERSVTPLSSTYLNVIGAEIDWHEIVALFAGARVHWDGASFFPMTAPGGGPSTTKLRAPDFARSKRASRPSDWRSTKASSSTGTGRLMVQEVPAQ